MFKAVNAKVDIQKLERDQQTFWRERNVFQRTMKEREGGPEYVFYEGPPTANGKPGSHHVLARAFKDMFPRYKVMRGYHCLRYGGWDTHGLPVEIEVQKELGIKFKHEVEEYGIAEFNKKCRDSVLRYLTDWEKMTDRIGFWVDLDNAYITFSNDYIQSVWWILKQFWEKSLLFQGYKVVPYCPECGTPLSSHEVAQGYETVEDPSVFVRFPLKDKPGVYFLVWTTTPWTLPANVALAVGENIDYVQVEGPAQDGDGTENLILAAGLVEKVLKNAEQYKIVKRFKGKELLNQHYNPLYTFLPVEQDYAYVVAGDFVSTEDGTGIVHIAPAFGADDLSTGQKYKLPVLRTVAPDGKIIDQVTKFRGMWFKDADPEITADLKTRGLLYKSGKYEHSYPFCWRSGTPLLYYARETWFIRTTEYRDKLVELNQTINWVPDHIKDGRFGNWLEDVKDWALGRERFWGTPLPIWVDDQTGETLCIGSVAELSQLAGRELADLDLHRPYVDEITFSNPNGKGGTMRRVPELIDVWFDSGAMPVAQWGYPHKNQDEFKTHFPADYICEAVDQTRGWFYSLHAISTMLWGEVAYKNVICLGHILDGEGKKMSKSKGNIVDPWDVLNKHGADAFRWYLYTSSPPGDPRRFSVDLVGEVVNKFWSTLWNTYSFFVTYANLDKWSPLDKQPAVADRDPLDQWVLAELNLLVKEVTEAYEGYNVTDATRPVQVFVERLSNWYVRLSRRRFWKGESDADKQGAYATLYECLTTIAKLIAPAMPFLSESLYRNLVASVDESAPDSVHLAAWPEFDPALIDMERINEMNTAERLVSLGRSARENANLKVRQPLASAQFVTRDAKENAAVKRLTPLIQSELNVKQVVVLEGASDVVAYVLNPLPSVLGKKLGKDFPAVQKALREGAQTDVTRWAKALLNNETVSVEVNGTTFEVTAAEVEVKQKSAEGFTIAEEGGYLAALDTRLSEDLILEGLAREVVRRIQTLRKEADFNIDDRIVVRYTAGDQIAKAITSFDEYIRTETLSDKLEATKPADGFFSKDDTLEGEAIALGVKRAKAK
ncbi:MAG: isoleucine--tRNA ligase [Chloroflexi bacterium]|nr:isoleucine--tRNA ligase [Chloroflexota bacterium]MCC6895618.1 isoleucine--tRNA ligase [Anaerolineae bacterium]